MTYLSNLRCTISRSEATEPSSSADTPTRKDVTGRLTMIAAALATAILLTACGGSHANHTRKSEAAGRTIAFAKCMRANGVPSFPDSGAALQSLPGSGSQSVSINGVAVSSPAFHSALQTCQHYISTPATPAQDAKFARETLKVARCMRAHGVPDFPDSGTWTGPNPNPEAPAFKAAAKDCGVGGVATSATLP